MITLGMKKLHNVFVLIGVCEKQRIDKMKGNHEKRLKKGLYPELNYKQMDVKIVLTKNVQNFQINISPEACL